MFTGEILTCHLSPSPPLFPSPSPPHLCLPWVHVGWVSQQRAIPSLSASEVNRFLNKRDMRISTNFISPCSVVLLASIMVKDAHAITCTRPNCGFDPNIIDFSGESVLTAAGFDVTLSCLSGYTGTATASVCSCERGHYTINHDCSTPASACPLTKPSSGCSAAPPECWQQNPPWNCYTDCPAPTCCPPDNAASCTACTTDASSCTPFPTSCTTALASGCTTLGACNANFFDTNNDATDGCETAATTMAPPPTAAPTAGPTAAPTLHQPPRQPLHGLPLRRPRLLLLRLLHQRCRACCSNVYV